MDPAMSTWRSSLWTRWLAWTIVFGVVAAGSWLASMVVRMTVPFSFPALLPYVPSLIAAFVIGQRFRSWWWLAGPLAVLAVPSAGVALWSARLMVGPQVSVKTVWGARTPRDSAEFLLVLLFAAAAMLGIMYTAAGVWWGKRQRKGGSEPG